MLESKDVFFVPRLKKKILSISMIEDRGYDVMFRNGQVLIHPEEASPDIAMAIEIRERNLYMLMGNDVQDLVHDSDKLCVLWNIRLGNLHYMMFPILREIFKHLPYFSIEYRGMCKGCVLGKNTMDIFLGSKSSSKGILDIVHSNVCGQMLVASVQGE